MTDTAENKRKRDAAGETPCAAECAHFIDECDCAEACFDANGPRSECPCSCRFDDRGAAEKPDDDLYRDVWHGMRENAEHLVDQFGAEDISIDRAMSCVVGEEEVDLAWMFNQQQQRSFVLSVMADELKKNHPFLRSMYEKHGGNPLIITGGCGAMSKKQRKFCQCVECRCERDEELGPQLDKLHEVMPKACALARKLLTEERDLRQFDEWCTDFQQLVDVENVNRDDTNDEFELGQTLAMVAVGEVLPEFDSTLRDAVTGPADEQ